MILPFPHALQEKLSKIPMLRAMEVDYRLYDGKQLQLTCPLSPNINDKGTFFGGSISALATICGWTMTSLKALEAGVNCDVVIAEQNLQFLKPACSELTATCECTITESFTSRLEAGRRARLDLTVSLHSDGECVASFNGRYVAVPT